MYQKAGEKVRETFVMVQTELCHQPLSQHHMLLLCSIKRGNWVRKRGRRRWLNILENQPGLVTSGDQVLKQMAH